MTLFDDAVIFAIKAHSGMIRKASNAPYILHPMEAAAIVGTMTDDMEILAAAVLHDVVEDTSITLKEIEKQFGQRIAALVNSETENKREDLPPDQTWRIRKEESIARLQSSDDIAVKMLWLGDKLSNMRAFYRNYRETGDLLWQSFNQKNKQEQEWYYRTIAESLTDLRDYPAWQEYNSLLNIVFSGGK